MILRKAGKYIQDRRVFFMVKQSKNLVGLFYPEDEGTAILRKVEEIFTQGTS